MTEAPPKRLYKYQPFSERTLTALKSRTVWFGRPSRLNDPFDCAVPYQLVPVTIEDCTRLFALRPDLAARMAEHPDSFDSNGRPTESTRRAIESGGRKALADIESTYADHGITCFSEDPDSILLWSHYGGGHRGLCLEFDTSSPLLDRLHRVRYTDDLPKLNVAEVMTGRVDMMWPFLTKASCWSYEREWRAVHERADTEYCYGIEALTGVYLGATLSDAEKDLVCHLLYGTPTRIYDVRRSASQFRLEFRKVEYTPYKHPPAEAV